MYYDELKVGQTARFAKTVTETDLAFFIAITGDANPMHVDEVAAAASPFGTRIVHGMLSGSLLCGVYGMQLPGPGAIHLEQQIKFKAPVRIGDTVTAHVELIELCGRRRVRMRSWCTRQDDVVVLEGEGLLLVPERPADQPAGANEVSE